VTVPRITEETMKMPSNVPTCSRPVHMLYDRRTGKLAYFPRKYSFELTFLDDLVYSRFGVMAKEKEQK
jgi:hypothetical protein